MDEITRKSLHALGLDESATLEDIKNAYILLTASTNNAVSWKQSKEILESYNHLLELHRSKQKPAAIDAHNNPYDNNILHDTVNVSHQLSVSHTRTKMLILASVICITLAFYAVFRYMSPPRIYRGDHTNTSELIKQIKPSIVTIKFDNASSGSGFVVSRDGYIVTNAHVMRQRTATAIFSDGYQIDVDLVSLDELKDFALVRAREKRDYPALEIGNSDGCTEGDAVLAAGAPLGLQFSFTKGIISAVKRSLPYVTASLIQTDAAINPGNSGGPLIDSNGRVIGINFMKATGDKIEGIGFAIAINEIKTYIETKRQMNDKELMDAIARADTKLSGYGQAQTHQEIEKAKERLLEEQWERDRRRREFNEKVEMANKDLKEQKERAESKLQEEIEQQRRHIQEISESKRRYLSDCLQNVTGQYQLAWNDQCRRINQQDGCALPSGIGALLEQRHGQARNECYRINQ